MSFGDREMRTSQAAAGHPVATFAPHVGVRAHPIAGRRRIFSKRRACSLNRSQGAQQSNVYLELQGSGMENRHEALCLFEASAARGCWCTYFLDVGTRDRSHSAKRTRREEAGAGRYPEAQDDAGRALSALA